MPTLEVTIYSRKDGAWPVIARRLPEGRYPYISVRGCLDLDLEALKDMKPPAYGEMLGKKLLSGEVRELFVESLAASDLDESRLRFVLTIEAPDLLALHWQRLRARIGRQLSFLASHGRVAFSLSLPTVTSQKIPSISYGDMRALVLVAGPGDLGRNYNLDRLDIKRISQAIQDAFAANEKSDPVPFDLLASDGDLDLSASEGRWAGPPTLSDLIRVLAEGRHTMLHLVCHGRRMQLPDKPPDTILYLPLSRDERVPVEGATFLKHLRAVSPPPCFVFFSTCESGGGEAGLGGVGQALLRDLGIPAVVAMNYRIKVNTALELTRAFYPRLREHGQLDRALAEASAGLLSKNDVNVPALYSLLNGRPLFSLDAVAPPSPKQILKALTVAVDLMGKRAPRKLEEVQRVVDEILKVEELDPRDLPEDLRRKYEQSLRRLNELCLQSLDLTFDALARKKRPRQAKYTEASPFPGLLPFRLKDQELFCGRRPLIDRLERMVGARGLLTVMGASGSGKSSLVLAGLLPRLHVEAKGLAYLKPGASPVARLDSSLAEVDAADPVVVVDQFEELFSQCTDKAQRSAFVDRLVELQKRRRTILTMRADFWGECAPYKRLKELMQANLELIAPMDATELIQAVQEQAELAGLSFEPGLLSTILDEVGEAPGAMPLVQHTLLELWKERHGRWLHFEGYQTIGKVQGAIARTAESVYQDPELSDRQRELLREIFLRLARLHIDEEGTAVGHDLRRRCPLKQLGPDPEEARKLVTRLTDKHLLVTDYNPAIDDAEVEVAHEALLRHWPRLRDWIVEGGDALRLRSWVSREAHEWVRNKKHEDYLIKPGKRLDDAAALLHRERGKFNPTEKEFVEASLSHKQELVWQTSQQPLEVEELGWGVIFSHDAPPAVREALAVLLEHRSGQTSRTGRYREFSGVDGYRPGETKRQFLARHGVGSGTSEPDQMPHFLLIVGDPESIPFTFQYELDVRYAVGRLHLDTPEEYARYAESVVQAEKGHAPRPRRVTLFGPRNRNDVATQHSADHLIGPVTTRLRAERPDWDVQAFVAEEATKSRLGHLLGGPDTPALLFTMSHGMAFANGDRRQFAEQGALLCQDWPGPFEWRREIPPEFYFSADDVRPDADLRGTLLFLSGCYTAGTPRMDDFVYTYLQPGERGNRKHLAPAAFVSSLSRRLLSHPQGGPLAIVAHVERQWGYSFMEGRGIKVWGVFLNALKRMLDGHPVGLAMEGFSQRYAELASELSTELQQVFLGDSVDQSRLADLGTSATDARNYVVLGDPAVHLRAYPEVRPPATEKKDRGQDDHGQIFF